MSSCGDSYCTSCRKVSCVSGTSASSLIAGVPQPCRSVFSCSVQHHTHKPTRKLPLPQPISGFVPTAVAKWPASGGSLLSKSSSSVPHRWPLPLHETNLSNSNPSRVPARSVPLRLRPRPIPSSRTHPAISQILYPRNSLPLSLVVLHATPLATLHTTPYPHSIPIGPASAATTGGFLQVAVSKARKTAPSPASTTRASDTQLRLSSQVVADLVFLQLLCFRADSNGVDPFQKKGSDLRAE